MLDIKNYDYKTWAQKYPNNKVSMKSPKIKVDDSWNKLFDKEMKKKYFKELEAYLSRRLEKASEKDRVANIYPYPDLVFNAFNLTPLNKVKVVIIGQDPYHNCEMHSDTRIPQAMGLSFSVPTGIKVPSSLQNIFNNQVKFKHLSEKPNNGNLEAWAKQGVLMLNTSLTVRHGYPNSHAKFWVPFTDEIIKYISNNLDNIIFVLWGRPALNKMKLINTDKHKIIASSHPSGLSANKKLGQYDSFCEKDHFKEINNYLKKHGEEEIVW